MIYYCYQVINILFFIRLIEKLKYYSHTTLFYINNNMEYQILYDVLYESLSNIIPKTIIESLIFKYVIDSNSYKYLYTISCIGFYKNVHFNKHLKIISCESRDLFKFIDYDIGKEYSKSDFDTQFFRSHQNNTILYFNDDTIFMSELKYVSKYVYSENKYIKQFSYSHDNQQVCIYNDFVYIMICGYGRYCFEVYDTNRLETKKSFTYQHNTNSLYMSIYNDMIYIYEYDSYTEESISIRTHDINDFRIISTYFAAKKHNKCQEARLYKNKLYQYALGQIFIYDVVSFEQIHSFKVNINDVNTIVEISISDDIILLSDGLRIILYEIK